MGANTLGYSLEPKYQPSHINQLETNVTSIIGDIRDLDKFKSTLKEFKPDIVFHLAAQPLVRYSYQNPIETFETNIMGTINILESVRQYNSDVSVVVITTDKCYQNIEQDYGYKESDRLGGYDPYSNSKACAELVTQSYKDSYFNINDFGSKHNTLIATARAGNVIGGGDWSDDRLIPDIIRAAINNKPVKIRNPNSVRPWQHVLESLSGYLLLGQNLLNSKTEYATNYNFGPINNESLSVSIVADIAKSCWAKINIEFSQQKSDLHEANLLILDCTKANKVLHWTPVWDEKTSIRNTIDWYKSYYEDNEIITNQQLTNYVDIAKSQGLIWTKY
jgi:CDP-glucose 4,6-dehydratase